MSALQHPRLQLRLDEARDWFSAARRVPSPNCDGRPPGVEISLVIIHGISLPPRQYGGPYIDQLFTNVLDQGVHPYFRDICDLRVSSHLLVDRAGSVTQYVPLHMRAWHAGKSSFMGRDACNDYSVGIELEGCDEEPYCDIQYAVAAQLVAEIRRAYPAVGPGCIARHSDVAPGRKTDPGAAFDWPRFLELVGGPASA